MELTTQLTTAFETIDSWLPAFTVSSVVTAVIVGASLAGYWARHSRRLKPSATLVGY